MTQQRMVRKKSALQKDLGKMSQWIQRNLLDYRNTAKNYMNNNENDLLIEKVPFRATSQTSNIIMGSIADGKTCHTDEENSAISFTHLKEGKCLVTTLATTTTISTYLSQPMNR